jgi:putative pectin methyltransferase
MSWPLYRGTTGIGVKSAAVYYDPKEPSENGIGGCGHAVRRWRFAPATVKIGILVLMAATLVGSVTWAGTLYMGHGACGCGHCEAWVPPLAGVASHRPA